MENLSIPVWVLIPFLVQLICIAVLPLTRLAEWWESNLHKLYVSLALGGSVAAWFLLNGIGEKMEEQIVYDYMPFMLLLTVLFVTTGGLHIKGDLKATPLTNCGLLALGYLLASFMGTTGAAMLLIRMLLQTISQRKYKTHTVLFYIAMVANCGGILTPLGDPPLFLLFQKGVHFTWFMSLAPEWLCTGILLLLIYFALDTYYYRREPQENLDRDEAEAEPIRLEGTINIFWLLCAIASTMFINPTYIPAMGASDAPFYVKLLREWAFLLIILLSMLTTKQRVRLDNQFSWTPILEVACVFCGIFATMTPALLFLQQHPLPISEPWQFLYGTGFLSAFLDNAPTAMVFHATATTPALLPTDATPIVGGISEILLRAISMGAIFFGSLTYIGNGPNFMVKSIAEESGINMPSFFGYMFKFSLIICLPVYVIVQLIFV